MVPPLSHSHVILHTNRLTLTRYRWSLLSPTLRSSYTPTDLHLVIRLDSLTAPIDCRCTGFYTHWFCPPLPPAHYQETQLHGGTWRYQSVGETSSRASSATHVKRNWLCSCKVLWFSWELSASYPGFPHSFLSLIVQKQWRKAGWTDASGLTLSRFYGFLPSGLWLMSCPLQYLWMRVGWPIVTYTHCTSVLNSTTHVPGERRDEVLHNVCTCVW